MAIRRVVRHLLLAAAIASDCESVLAEFRARPEPIFRHVSLGSFGRIELGRVPSEIEKISEEVGPGVYRLRPNSFGGAEAIMVITNSAGVISEIRFQYGIGYDFSEKRSTYEKSLGPSSRTDRVGDTETAVWNDGRTQIELVRKIGQSYASFLIMRDVSRGQ